MKYGAVRKFSQFHSKCVSRCQVYCKVIGYLVSKDEDEGLTLETSVFESFTVANLPNDPVVDKVLFRIRAT